MSENLETESRKNKVGNFITIIGCMGSGKSPIAKSIVKNSNLKNKIVCDIRKEYNTDIYTLFYDYEIFRDKLKTFKHSAIIIEEATAVIGSFRDKELLNLITGVEHNNNIIIPLFHGCEFVPKYIRTLGKYFIFTHPLDRDEILKEFFSRHYERLVYEKNKVKKLVKDYSSEGMQRFYKENPKYIGKLDVYVKN